jgi:hypothetical protein
VTAPIGANVGLYVDLVERVSVGDIIETRSGRRCVVVERDADHKIVATQNGDGIDIAEVRTKIHRIRWYVRGRR